MNITAMLGTYEMTIIFKAFLAVAYGGLIGMERQAKHRPAGFRTHMLVCLGAMTVMALSLDIFKQYHETYRLISDPMRMSAQVISGIGFLGAGTIIHHGASVKGLTTAASLWVVAAIGLTIGAGYYFLASVVTFLSFAILLIFSAISKKVNESGNVHDFLIKIVNKPKCFGSINYLIVSVGAKTLDMELLEDSENEAHEESKDKIMLLKLTVQLPSRYNHTVFVKQLEDISGTLSVEKI